MTDDSQDRKYVLERHVYTINLGETVLNGKLVKKKLIFQLIKGFLQIKNLWKRLLLKQGCRFSRVFFPPTKKTAFSNCLSGRLDNAD